MSAATVSWGRTATEVRRWECSSTASGTTSGTTRRRRRAGSCAAKVAFRNWITPDGSPGPTGRGGFRAEPNRYHLYVAFACPWAHRTLIMRKLKGLESLIDVSAVNSYMGAEGWTFAPGPRRFADSVNRVERLYELYTLADREVLGPRDRARPLGQARAHDRVERVGRDRPHAEQRVRRRRRESTTTTIPRSCAPRSTSRTRSSIRNVNNGVYRAGFATTQEAYEEAANALFAALDELEGRLATRALPHRRPLHRGRHSIVHDADSLRSRRTTGTSSATCAASSTTRTSGDSCATSTRCRASRTRVHIDFIKRHYYGSHAEPEPASHRAGRPEPELPGAARPRAARAHEPKVSSLEPTSLIVGERLPDLARVFMTNGP